MSPEELRRGGTCNPIKVDISTTLHLGHGRRVHGSGGNDLETFLPRLFFGKTKTLSPIVGTLSTMKL